MQGYWKLGRDPRFFLLALASGIPFNGMFLYVLAAPVFLGEHLALAPTQFFWFFVLTIAGIMGGAWVSGRMAGRVAPKKQIRLGFLIMLAVAVVNLAANLLLYRACDLGHAADCGVCLWLGHDGAGGDAAGVGLAPRTAWHGIEPAGVHWLNRQWPGGGCGDTAGDAFDRQHGVGVAADVVDWHAGLGWAAPSLAGHWPCGRAPGGVMR
jgi:hypothetical protein